MSQKTEKVRTCDFCKAELGKDTPWKVKFTFGRMPAFFEKNAGPPDACGECVAKMLDAVDVQVQTQSNQVTGELLSLRLVK